MKAVAFAVLAFAQAAASAGDLSADCPLTIVDTSISVRAPVGWVGSAAQSTVHLSEFGMMAGAPETKTYLVPYSRKPGKDKGSSMWVFAEGDEKWLYCRYGGTGLIQISKRLDDAATSCTITRTSDKRGTITRAAVVCTNP